MPLLPKKPGPQLWEDVVLPIFDQPEPVAPKQQSKKQEDDAKQVKWRRRPRTARQVPCEVCVKEHPQGLREGVGTASYIRSEGTTEQWVCYHHHAEMLHREELGKP